MTNDNNHITNSVQNMGIAFKLDAKGDFIHANDEAENILGINTKELYSQPFGVFIRPDFLRKTIEFYRHQLKNDDQFSYFELPIINSNNEEVWIGQIVEVVQDINGKNLFFAIAKKIANKQISEKECKTPSTVSTIVDYGNTSIKSEERYYKNLIDELAIRNSELRQNQQYLKAINEFAKHLIATIKIDDVVKEITENIIEKFGFSDCVVYLVDETKTILYQIGAYGPKNNNGEIFKPITIKVGEGVVGAVARSGKSEIVNDTSKDARYIIDDKVRLSELAVPVIADDEVIGVIDTENEARNYYTQQHLETLQTIAGLAATKIKNTLIRKKQKNADRELFESEKKMRMMINSALDAVITINDQGTVTEWNPQAEELFGFTQNEAIGAKLSELIIPENYREAHERGMKQFMRTGEGSVLNKRIEVLALNKLKKEFPIEISMVLIKSRGRHYFTAFVRDITMRKKAEEDMKEALRKQKELNALKNRFVSMTSHELRTPLTTVQTNIELLEFYLKKEQAEFSEKHQIKFDRILSEIKRLTDLMNDILLVGKIQSGKISCNPEFFDFKKLCSEVTEELNIINQDPIELTVIGKHRQSFLDPKTFRHAISNLISNAVKYSEGCPSPKVTLSYRDNDLKIEIIDFGVGIPKEQQKQVYDAFFRASNVGNILGTGLGLAIVKEIVGLHHGTISLEGEENKGTTFTIYQPDRNNFLN